MKLKNVFNEALINYELKFQNNIIMETLEELKKFLNTLIVARATINIV